MDITLIILLLPKGLLEQSTYGALIDVIISNTGYFETCSNSFDRKHGTTKCLKHA